MKSMKNSEIESDHTFPVPAKREHGTGPGSAGQSGDTQGLSDVAEAGSESVEELVEEGQYTEAALIESMEKEIDGELYTSETGELDLAKKHRRRDK